jgi:hypothetical protein
MFFIDKKNVFSFFVFVVSYTFHLPFTEESASLHFSTQNLGGPKTKYTDTGQNREPLPGYESLNRVNNFFFK